MDCRRGLFAVLVACGCTKSNPEFDAHESGETRGADDKADDSADSPESEAGSVDDTTTMTGAESTEDEGATTGMLESSGGPFECAEMIDRDWEVQVFSLGARLEIPCETTYVLEGTVSNAREGVVGILPCDNCPCTATGDPIEIHAPDLLLPVFGSGSCARVEIEWSKADLCRPVGFTMFSNAPADVLTPVILAGQDLKTLPTAVGAAELEFSTVSPCQCPECCPQTGVAALTFVGVQIAEDNEDDVPDLLGDNVSWHATVFEAHVHDDCSPAISWRAISNEL